MNFFKRQDESRRASRRLIVLFVLAVMAVVFAVDLLVFAALSAMQGHLQGDQASLMTWISWNPGVVLATTLIVLGIIGLASLYKTMVLGGGGGVVARSLGGVRISGDTGDPLQRRLLNVVEEISIASGVPMPEVYLLEQEAGINAFAAGHNPSNAAIGVTRGALTLLNRAELQGVIAHEFSHILNGDMKLNLRLMGLLFGLLVIALIARTILRLAGQSRGGGKRGAAIPLLLVFALGVLIVGYVGLFFGRLIQAAVSRRRESLADASAVQFTRDPTGLRNALVKIGANAGGSRIGNAEVEEVAHMLFAPGIKRFMATHPPLIERLTAIDPRFDAKEIETMRARMLADAELQAPRSERTAASAASLHGVIDLPAAPLVIAELVANPGTAHMRLAREIRESLPQSLVLAGQHADSAQALLMALALGGNGELRQQQMKFIAQRLGSDVEAAARALQDDVDALDPEQRMPALLRSFAMLRQLPREQRMRLMSCLNGMLQWGAPDRPGSLRSYVLRKLAQVHLRDELEPSRRQRQLSLRGVQEDVQVLFSVLARYGHEDDVASRRAYEAGACRVYPRQRPAYGVPEDWASRLDVALSRLDQLAPVAKEQLLDALLRTVTHDQQLTLGEAELLRAICASLHCPLPPLMAKVQRDPPAEPQAQSVAVGVQRDSANH